MLRKKLLTNPSLVPKPQTHWHRPTSQSHTRTIQRAQGRNFLDLLINLRKSEKNGKNEICLRESQCPLDVKPTPRKEWPQGGLTHAVYTQFLRSGHSAASDSKPPFPTTIIQEEFSLQEGSQPDTGITNTANSHRTHTVCTFPAIHSLATSRNQWSPWREKKKWGECESERCRMQQALFTHNPKIQNETKSNIFRNLRKQNKSLIKRIKVTTNYLKHALQRNNKMSIIYNKSKFCSPN